MNGQFTIQFVVDGEPVNFGVIYSHPLNHTFRAESAVLSNGIRLVLKTQESQNPMQLIAEAKDADSEDLSGLLKSSCMNTVATIAIYLMYSHQNKTWCMYHVTYSF